MFFTCVSTDPLSVDLILRGNARDLLSFTETQKVPSILEEKRGLFLNQLSFLIKPILSTSATADQDPDVFIGWWVGEKKKRKMEVSMPSPKVTGILQSVAPC